MELIIVNSDDWMWIYIDGKLTCPDGEGHSLEITDLIDCINSYYKDSNSLKPINYKNYCIDDEYVEEVGSMLPILFKDIPENVLC